MFKFLLVKLEDDPVLLHSCIFLLSLSMSTVSESNVQYKLILFLNYIHGTNKIKKFVFFYQLKGTIRLNLDSLLCIIINLHLIVK